MSDQHETVARLARETPLDITAATKVINLLISAGIDPDDATLTSTQILDAWALARAGRRNLTSATASPTT